MKGRIQFYRTLETLLDAGVPLLKALRQSFPGKFRKVAPSMADKMETEGISLSEAMLEFPHVFSFLESQLVAAGEHTGRLPVIFRSLAEIYEFRQRLIKNMISEMVYPVMVYHAASLLMPVISSILEKQTSLTFFILKVAIFLTPFYFVIFMIFFVKFIRRHFEITTPKTLSKIILFCPLIGTIIFRLACSTFFYILGFCLKAGVPVSYAIRISANAVSNTYLHSIFFSVGETIEKTGSLFSEILKERLGILARDSILFPLLETGEMSGTMDDACANIASIYREQTESTLKLIAKILPKLIYIIMVIYIAIKILSFWTKLFAKTTALYTTVP